MKHIEEYKVWAASKNVSVVEMAPGVYRHDRWIDVVTPEHTFFMAFSVQHVGPKPARTAWQVYGSDWHEYATDCEAVIESEVERDYWLIVPGFANFGFDSYVQGDTEAEALKALVKWLEWRYKTLGAVLDHMKGVGV